MRLLVYERDMGLCQEEGCGVWLPYDGPLGVRAELHHMKNRAGDRCDCGHNLEIRCARHHRGREGKHA